MADARPFRALLPAAGAAPRVAAPPYDVVDLPEARRVAAGNPLSFLHVTRAEIDFPDGTDPHACEVYRAGGARLRRLVDEGALARAPADALYVYREESGGRAQTGVVAAVSVDAYARGDIRRHEKTRPDKVEDRVRHMEAARAHTEPVFLMYRAAPRIDALVEAVRAGAPALDFVDGAGVRQALWVCTPGATEGLARAFEEVGRLYIADGHHRSESALLLRERVGSGAPGAFPAVLFPDRDLSILPYNRIVRPGAGSAIGEGALLARLRGSFDVVPGGDGRPAARRTICVSFGERWIGLRCRDEAVAGRAPDEALDVALLQDLVFAPVWGIEDPRRDPRLEFVGGGDPAALARRAREAGGAAFSLFPVGVEEIMQVADLDRLMPPKSTWFHPKITSGLFVKPFDGDGGGDAT